MKRHLLFALSAVGVVAMTHDAKAEVPSYDALPSGALTTLPTAEPPASIAASEKAPGIFVVSQKHSRETPAESRYITVIGDAKGAERVATGEGFDPDEDGIAACLTQSHRNFSPKGMKAHASDDEDENGDPDAKEWQTSQMWQVNLWPKGRNNPSGGVTAVHSERVVTANGKTSLESVDAWVDPQTRGARLIARASLPLTLVGSAVGGVKVYAARDDRPNRKLVEFVVVKPRGSGPNRGNAMMGIRQDGQNMHGSGCGHVRMPLVVSATGDAGVVMAPTELPSRSSDASESAPSEANAKEPEEAAKPPIAKPVSVGKRLGPKALVKRLRKPQVDPESAFQPPVEREIRTRDMQIHLSVSQTSRDPRPILAVSFGWAGRESLQRTFERPRPSHDD
ncbi:MAG: hypothetical protein JST00_03115 [Deltaproteobacteria bacterium]|nr:hypothetical protein [Deltaproteobacteria bacterium]